MFDRFLNARLYGVIARYNNGKPSLVFCTSRKGVRTSAQQIVKDAAAAQPAGGPHRRLGGVPGVGAPAPLFATAASIASCQAASKAARDPVLRECLLQGVGFHSAGEMAEDRRVVERLFLSGNLPVLCTTTTLAMGEPPRHWRARTTAGVCSSRQRSSPFVPRALQALTSPPTWW